MTRTLLTGNAAAAWGARLADVEYIPAFPITPQTEIIERLSQWIDTGEMDARMTMMESEHAMLTAAGAAAATGVRVFTATSSQGLLYAMEMLYTISGWRVPLVLVNVSRGVASPITLEADHTDVMAARDSGLLQLHCATVQEVLDSVLLAFHVAEDRRVRLPVIVNLDGFYLSFTREAVRLPEPELVRTFLPPVDRSEAVFRGGRGRSHAVAVLGGTPYSYFRYQQHLGAMAGHAAYEDAAAGFETAFGRRYEAVECFMCDDADYVFVMIGAFATKAKAAVRRLREAGWKIGLVRPRMLRPFPEAEIAEALAGRRGVAVIDQNLSMGMGGVLHAELSAALFRAHAEAPAMTSFVGGLGGRDIPYEEFLRIAEVTRDAAATGERPPPRLLFSEAELAQTRRLQGIARGA